MSSTFGSKQSIYNIKLNRKLEELIILVLTYPQESPNYSNCKFRFLNITDIHKEIYIFVTGIVLHFCSYILSNMNSIFEWKLKLQQETERLFKREHVRKLTDPWIKFLFNNPKSFFLLDKRLYSLLTSREL